ncbi:MAG: diguanylate cyclase [Planctomycetaceae bacterium]
MRWIPTSVRLTFCLVSLTVSCLLLAATCGLIPDTRSAVMNGRAELCESIAINHSVLATRGDVIAMKASLKAIQERNVGIESLAVRRASGELEFEFGEHSAHWQPSEDGRSSDTQILVPISQGEQLWGTIEVRFQPIRTSGWRGLLREPLFQLVLFMSVVGALGFLMFLSHTLRQLNPTKVIPSRVRSALDTLTEGLLILDDQQRIVLANVAFSRIIGREPDKLVGFNMSELPWRNHDSQGTDKLKQIPWREAFDSATPTTGVLLDLQVTTEQRRTFLVNAAPIFSEKNRCQGVLTSLEDVTPMEQKKKELHFTMEQLKQSAEEIRQQNEKLERLATTDPLTECLNRRSFFPQFETLWKTAERHRQPIACIMVDVDHFKSVNDTHGHATGDEVLRGVAAVLRNTARVGDLVCRFGGEEFCVLLPCTEIDEAKAAGERFRLAIAAAKFPKLSITASIGVSARSLGASDPQEMLDQADKCLYVAKRNGRNQVVGWDNVPSESLNSESLNSDLLSHDEPTSRAKHEAKPETADQTIPYRAVTALLSTLSYRHQPTAAHCRRVADLCVILAESRMSLRDCYLVETAALLHDIGKIGVPDAILLKQSALTREEWDLMRHHSTIGLEIVRASFGNARLTQIIEAHEAFFGGTQHHPNFPTGLDIPLGARILAVADAFDSMTNDSVYRQAMTVEQAIAELRQCAGAQFDPELVESLIDAVSSRTSTHSTWQAEAVTRDAAVDVGNQIENLVAAIDDHDIERLRSLADRLKATAQLSGISPIATSASSLEAAVAENADLLDILESACELVDLCRSTQRAFLQNAIA